VGWGWQSIAFVCWLVFYQAIYRFREVLSIGGNDLLYEKNAEVRITCYHPKTTPKRVLKPRNCWVSACFLYSLLPPGFIC